MDKVKEKINGKVVDAIPCTVCPSSDALRVYEKINPKTGATYFDAFCFKCNHFEPNPPGYQRAEDMMPANTFSQVPAQTGNRTGFGVQSEAPTSPKQTLEEVLSDFKTYPIRAIANRGLTKETCEKYGVRVSLSPHDGETILSHKYPYYRNNKLTGFKERIVEGKMIFSKGDCKDANLFGSHCTNQGGKTLYITEGELDCLALYQVLKALSGIPGWEPSVVSLSHGAASAARDISNDFDFVNSFEKIVLVFDQDDAGQAAVEDACKILAGKVYIAKMSEKDPNDMLLKGKAEDLKWEVMKHARQYMPDNIVNFADCWDRYKNSRNQTCYPFPESWKGLNNMTYGVRSGELVMITSGSGMGGPMFSPFMW